jgi:hypothetical protein
VWLGARKRWPSCEKLGCKPGCRIGVSRKAVIRATLGDEFKHRPNCDDLSTPPAVRVPACGTGFLKLDMWGEEMPRFTCAISQSAWCRERQSCSRLSGEPIRKRGAPICLVSGQSWCRGRFGSWLVSWVVVLLEYPRFTSPLPVRYRPEGYETGAWKTSQFKKFRGLRHLHRLRRRNIIWCLGPDTLY